MIRALEISLAISLVLGIFVALPLLVVSGLYSLKFGNCLRFPNGNEIGHEAYIDFSYPYFSPEAVVRAPSGKIIAKEVSPLHITEKATFGYSTTPFRRRVSGLDPEEDDFSFIWTRETGVVGKDQNPDLYLNLKQVLGENYYGIPKEQNSNTLWAVIHLKDDPQFQSDTCHTALMTW